MRNLKVIQTEIEQLCNEGEAILEVARQENRELTATEQVRFNEIYGTKDGEGLLAKLKQEEAREVRAENERAEIIARRAAKVGMFQNSDDGDSMRSRRIGKPAMMRSQSGQQVVMLRNDQSLESHYRNEGLLDAQLCSNPLGELAKAVVCGVNKFTPEVVAAAATNSNSTGGYLVPDSFTPFVVDLARSSARVMQAGAMMIPMDTQQVMMATIEQDPTFETKVENEAFTESTITFGQRVLKAYTIGTLVKASRELVEDAPNFAQLFESILGRALAVELDRLTLVGTGSAEPLGLLTDPNTPDSNVASGSNPVWQDVGEAAIAIREANYEPNAVLLSPTVHGHLQHLQTGDGVNAAANWLGIPPTLESQVMYPTSNMPSTSIVVGQWNMLAWGIRSGARIEVTTEGGDAFAKHQVFFKIVFRGDWMPMDHSAFFVKDGISLS